MKYIALLLVCALLFSGCLSLKKTDSTLPATEPQPTEEPATIPITDETASEPTDTAPVLFATIYYGNDNADGFETKSIAVTELNTATLVQELISAGILAEGTEVISEELKGTCLYLDFNDPFRTRLCSMGTSGEYIIMGSLVNTFLDNFMDTIQSVYVTVNGEILESGHVIYDFEMSRYN